MSIVFYKFRSAKDFDKCTFDGNGISVFDLKKEIMSAKRLGKGTDFDLALYNAQTNDEYKDDGYVIPRNTSVLVSRNPPARPGRGTAARYASGGASIPTGPGGMSSSSSTSHAGTGGPTGGSGGYGGHGGGHFGYRGGRGGSFRGGRGGFRPVYPSPHNLNPRIPRQQLIRATAPTPATSTSTSGPDEGINAMFKQQDEQWQQTQTQMATARPVYRPYRPRPFRPFNPQQPGASGAPAGTGAPGSSAATYSQGQGQQQNGQQQPFVHRPPPDGYICHRCGQKGHWRQQCPTLEDPNFDNKPSLKRTTGIPKSFLQTVESRGGSENVMVSQTGELVAVQMNDSAWKDLTRRVKSTGTTVDISSLDIPPEYTCQICKALLREAVSTDCCSTRCCDECIRTSLDGGTPTGTSSSTGERFKCPFCGKRQTPDQLIVDSTLRRDVEFFVRSGGKQPEFISSSSPAPGSGGNESPLNRGPQESKPPNEDANATESNDNTTSTQHQPHQQNSNNFQQQNRFPSGPGNSMYNQGGGFFRPPQPPFSGMMMGIPPPGMMYPGMMGMFPPRPGVPLPPHMAMGMYGGGGLTSWNHQGSSQGQDQTEQDGSNTSVDRKRDREDDDVSQYDVQRQKTN